MATLFIAATPIGNLGDISPRIAYTLRKTSIIAAESIRNTKKLLNYLGIKNKKLISCREVNRKKILIKIKEHLDIGKNVILVSDAGTPGINDPGEYIIANIINTNHNISPLPGPSALTTALSVTGWINYFPLIFLGFLPRKNTKRRQLLEKIKRTGWYFIFFEAPHRLIKTFKDLADLMQNRTAVIAKELTKANENLEYNSCSQLFENIKKNKIKGEIIVLISGEKNTIDEKINIIQSLDNNIQQNTNKSQSQIAKHLASIYGESKNEIYKKILKMKKKDKHN